MPQAATNPPHLATASAIAGWSPPVVPFGSDIVVILVGTEQHKFAVHQNLICAASRFFSSAFRGGFAETFSGVIKLPIVKPKLFEFVYRWLYSDPCLIGEPVYIRASDIDRHPDELLLSLYQLADYLLIPGMKLLVREQLRDLFSAYEATIPSHEFIRLLFKDDQLTAVQSYIIKHIGYWMSKSKDKDEWVKLIQVHSKLTLGMAIEFANLDTTHVDALKVVHPSKVVDHGIERGLDLLGVEARSNDVEPKETAGAKVLGKFRSTCNK